MNQAMLNKAVQASKIVRGCASKQRCTRLCTQARLCKVVQASKVVLAARLYKVVQASNLIRLYMVLQASNVALAKQASKSSKAERQKGSKQGSLAARQQDSKAARKQSKAKQATHARTNLVLVQQKLFAVVVLIHYLGTTTNIKKGGRCVRKIGSRTRSDWYWPGSCAQDRKWPSKQETK